MSTQHKHGSLITLVLASSLLIAGAVLAAEESMVYAGAYPAVLKSVEAANVVDVSAEVWWGYERPFRITLRGIVTPQVTEDAPACQLALAREALEFTKAYLKGAEKIEVWSITMSDSAQQDGHANIVTEDGSLADQLRHKGLARSDSIEEDTPWCT